VLNPGGCWENDRGMLQFAKSLENPVIPIATLENFSRSLAELPFHYTDHTWVYLELAYDWIQQRGYIFNFLNIIQYLGYVYISEVK
jgi:hypothetical protein